MSGSGVSIFEADARDRQAWDGFTRRTPQAELGHQGRFHDLLLATFGLGTLRLAARRGEEWVGILPLVSQASLFGKFLTSVPYLSYGGVLSTDAQARQELAAEALRLADLHHADRLELRGRQGSDLPIEVWPGKCSYVLELADREEKLWADLGAKTRSQVKRPQKEGYTARVSGPPGPPGFYALLAQRWHDLGSPVLPRRFFADFERLFGDTQEYVVVEKGGLLIAAGAMLHDDSRAEMLWSASAPSHNRFGVNMLLYWTALARATGRGARRFDFGRSTPGTGNASFKLQWGAREQPLEWNVQVKSGVGRTTERGDRRRERAAAVWRAMPARIARALGPILAARIPL